MQCDLSQKGCDLSHEFYTEIVIRYFVKKDYIIVFYAPVLNPFSKATKTHPLKIYFIIYSRIYFRQMRIKNTGLLRRVTFTAYACTLLNNGQTIEECDATGIHSSNAARLKTKKMH